MSSSRHRGPRRAAFTLVELMAVIVLIGLLAGAVTLTTRSYLIAGKQAVVRLEISKICQAIDTYYAAYDSYPSNDEGIEAVAKPSERFPEALLSKVPVDPWGNPYEYIQPGRDLPYEVISYGADRREGGNGANQDISSRDLGSQERTATSL